MSEADASRGWTFLTNHAHALVCITRDPGIRVREIAARIGITERATQRIVADLAREGYIEKARVGRRTSYTVNGRLPLRHPVEDHREIGALLEALSPRADSRQRTSRLSYATPGVACGRRPPARGCRLGSPTGRGHLLAAI